MDIFRKVDELQASVCGQVDRDIRIFLLDLILFKDEEK